MKAFPNIWRWFFALAALEAGAAFVALAAIPGQGAGYSAARLGILFLLGAGFVVSGWLFLRPGKWQASFAKMRFAILSAAVAALLGICLFLLRYVGPGQLLPYYERLAPLLWYLLFVSGEFAIFCLVGIYGLQPSAVSGEIALWGASGIGFVVLLVGYVLVAVTRIGLTPDSAYWGEPGVPVLAWQFAVALGCALCLFIASLNRGGGLRWEVMIATTLWVIAVVIWLSVPTDVLKNSFYAPINPPANQPYPNSDAGYYDSMAQSLLVGYPYQGDIPTRPLYVVFLAALHLIFGERYSLIIAGQTMLLALIPVVLYFLGTRIHSRTAGVLAALFAIFREWNSLLVSSQTRVSNTKMLLADLPTLLLILLACLFVVRWLQRRGAVDALLAGGLLGLLLLLRTQSILLLPITLAMGLVTHGLRGRAWASAAGLFLIGVAAALVPWLVHNYMHTGRLTLDAPFQYQVIASQYRYTGNLDIGTIDLNGKSLAGILIEFALKDPKFVGGFIAAHFSATLIDSLLILPLAARYEGLFAPLNLYWMNWPADLDALNAALLLPYLAVISVGIGAAWKRLRWAGLVPAAFALGYALANGIGRFSGWRYDLPADWVGYFYLAVGSAELLGMLALLLGARADHIRMTRSEEAPARVRWQWLGLISIAFMLAGSLPWSAEALASPRYADQNLAVLVDTLRGSEAVQRLNIDNTEIQSFLAKPQTTVQIGRLLYPRFFPRNTGLPSTHPWPAYAVRDYARLGFLLLNQSRHDAIFLVRQPGPGFAQGADAIVLGCQRTDHIEVRLIFFPGSDSAYLSSPLTQTCN